MPKAHGSTLLADALEWLQNAAARSLADPAAVTYLTFPTAREAARQRLRLYKVRRRNRIESRRLYPPSHPAWDTSEFDDLVLTIDNSTIKISRWMPKATAAPIITHAIKEPA